MMTYAGVFTYGALLGIASPIASRFGDEHRTPFNKSDIIMAGTCGIGAIASTAALTYFNAQVIWIFLVPIIVTAVIAITVKAKRSKSNAS